VYSYEQDYVILYRFPNVIEIISMNAHTPCPTNLPEENQRRKASRKMCAAGGEKGKATEEGRSNKYA